MQTALTEDQIRARLAELRHQEALEAAHRTAALKTALLQPGVQTSLVQGYLADLAEEYHAAILSEKTPLNDHLRLAVAVQRYRDAKAMIRDLEAIAAAPTPALPTPPDAE